MFWLLEPFPCGVPGNGFAYRFWYRSFFHLWAPEGFMRYAARIATGWNFIVESKGLQDLRNCSNLRYRKKET
jgi:hypothetical protein